MQNAQFLLHCVAAVCAFGRVSTVITFNYLSIIVAEVVGDCERSSYQGTAPGPMVVTLVTQVATLSVPTTIIIIYSATKLIYL